MLVLQRKCQLWRDLLRGGGPVTQTFVEIAFTVGLDEQLELPLAVEKDL